MAVDQQKTDAQSREEVAQVKYNLERTLAYQKYREGWPLNPMNLGKPKTQDEFNVTYDLTVNTPLEGLIEP